MQRYKLQCMYESSRLKNQTDILSKLRFETKMTKVSSKNLLMKNCKNNFIFLPDYVFHESFKEFWKNSHFENMRAGFPRRCQNSLRQNSPEMMHFQA